MRPERLLARIARGDRANVSFTDLRRLAEALGFELRRTNGSHHVFAHARAAEIITLQDVHGQAKQYQVRQLLRLVERYALTIEGDR
jgi:predicted RNA binding protein YcfA (HicA-like mRNA interferase family)